MSTRRQFLFTAAGAAATASAAQTKIRFGGPIFLKSADPHEHVGYILLVGKPLLHLVDIKTEIVHTWPLSPDISNASANSGIDLWPVFVGGRHLC